MSSAYSVDFSCIVVHFKFDAHCKLVITFQSFFMAINLFVRS